MLPSADVKFNYEMLPSEKAESARAAAERVRVLVSCAVSNIIEAGKELAHQKQQLGHGNFKLWVAAELDVSYETVVNWMRVSREFGDKNVNLTFLKPSVLYALAAPSTPEPVRQEVLARAEAGEKVTAKQIEELRKKLTKAEDLIKEKESQRKAQESLANIADKQAREAANRAMFAEADKQRLADELLVANEEIERLKEPGVITIDPIRQFNDVFVEPIAAQTPWTDDDAQFLTIQKVWKDTSMAARVRFMSWAGLTSRGDELAA